MNDYVTARIYWSMYPTRYLHLFRSGMLLLSLIVVNPVVPFGSARFLCLSPLMRLKKVYPAVLGRLHERRAKRNKGERRRLQQRIRRGQRRHCLAVRHVSCSFFSCAHIRLRVLTHGNLPEIVGLNHPVHRLVVFFFSPIYG